MSAGLSGQPPLAGWAPFAVVLAVSAALLGFDLGGRVLATNDEARFPMMARDIGSNGHWLLREISGVPMLNKPPLHAWLIALSAWPTGAVSQRTAVVPSFLGALGLVAVTYWIAQRVFGVGAGLAAGLIVATTAGVFAMARSAVPDMTLSFGIAAAMAASVAAELRCRPGAGLGFHGLVGGLPSSGRSLSSSSSPPHLASDGATTCRSVRPAHYSLRAGCGPVACGAKWRSPLRPGQWLPAR